jgi:hypothetical protein
MVIGKKGSLSLLPFAAAECTHKALKTSELNALIDRLEEVSISDVRVLVGNKVVQVIALLL